MKYKHLKIILLVSVFLAATAAAFWAANSLEDNESFRNFLESAGIFGIILVAIIGGLNAVVPIPPATFAPLFLEVGFSHILIITGFVIGTFIADSVGYLLGWYGRDYAKTSFPKLAEKINHFLHDHSSLVMPFTWLYVAFAPLPNEVLLIPLALSGYPYKKLILPLVVGNLFHHSILVYGYQNIFEMFF